MSVYIKGMKAPDKCFYCAYQHEGWCGLLPYSMGACSYNGKHPDCPLIELPDHGDLIDRDKLKHGFCVECTLYPDNCLKDDCDWGSIYHIEHAPVVIPAERSEDPSHPFADDVMMAERSE